MTPPSEQTGHVAPTTTPGLPGVPDETLNERSGSCCQHPKEPPASQRPQASHPDRLPHQVSLRLSRTPASSLRMQGRRFPTQVWACSWCQASSCQLSERGNNCVRAELRSQGLLGSVASRGPPGLCHTGAPRSPAFLSVIPTPAQASCTASAQRRELSETQANPSKPGSGGVPEGEPRQPQGGAESRSEGLRAQAHQ